MLVYSFLGSIFRVVSVWTNQLLSDVSHIPCMDQLFIEKYYLLSFKEFSNTISVSFDDLLIKNTILIIYMPQDGT